MPLSCGDYSLIWGILGEHESEAIDAIQIAPSYGCSLHKHRPWRLDRAIVLSDSLKAELPADPLPRMSCIWAVRALSDRTAVEGDMVSRHPMR
jgi:hypothetical protein